MENPISGMGVSEFDAGGDRQDELFDALSNSRRRFLLHFLRTGEPPVSVAELTTELAAWEAQRPAADRSADGEVAVKLSLVHNHLPKMAEAGFVEYDHAQQTVTLADRTDEVRAHLRTMAGDQL